MYVYVCIMYVCVYVRMYYVCMYVCMNTLTKQKYKYKRKIQIPCHQCDAVYCTVQV